MEKYDVIIIGLGAAGASAGIYARRFGLRTLIIGKEPGGQANDASEIENYPGVFKVSGFELMQKFREQAKALGAEIMLAEATDVSKRGRAFRVKTASKEYEGKAVIFATGSRKRRLGVPGEQELLGKGVSYCATCDGPFFKGKTVCVIGGGDSAVCSAVLLAEHAKKVYMIYRKEKKDMRTAPYCLHRAEASKNVEMIFRTYPVKINGRDRVESVAFKRDGRDVEFRVDGVFVEIGTEPQNELAKKLGVSLTEQGRINVANNMATNVAGIFAAGDVTSGSGDFEQVVTAAAEGAIAARSAYKYVKKS